MGNSKITLARGDRIMAEKDGWTLVKNDLNLGYWMYNPKQEGILIGADHGETQMDATMIAEFHRFVNSSGLPMTARHLRILKGE